MLRDNIDFLRTVYEWAKKKKISVRLIMNSRLVQHLYPEIFVTIPEWMRLIDNAKYVITDSYHGAALSFVFRKKFGLIPFFGCESDLRINDLFKRFNRDPPFLRDGDFSKMEAADDAVLKLEEIYKTYNAAWLQKILSK
jgi:hypothetical protein